MCFVIRMHMNSYHDSLFQPNHFKGSPSPSCWGCLLAPFPRCTHSLSVRGSCSRPRSRPSLTPATHTHPACALSASARVCSLRVIVNVTAVWSGFRMGVFFRFPGTFSIDGRVVCRGQFHFFLSGLCLPLLLLSRECPSLCGRGESGRACLFLIRGKQPVSPLSMMSCGLCRRCVCGKSPVSGLLGVLP